MAEMNVPQNAFGGMLRFKEEFDSRFKISPAMVIVMIVCVIILVLSLRLFFPIAS